MGDKSGINWTHATWNFLRGCFLKNKDCINCYAMHVAHRYDFPGGPYEGLTKVVNGHAIWNGVVRYVPHLMDQPIRWSRPRLIFVNSMSDVWHEDVSMDIMIQACEVMQEASWHQFQVLTKRSARQAELLPQITLKNGRNMGKDPLENVWWGISVGCEDNAPLLLDLAETPAIIRWISAEPLHANVDWEKWLPISKAHWVVLGGESQAGCREMKTEWVEGGIAVCRAVGIKPYVKQMGEVWAREHGIKGDRTAEQLENLPESCRVREWPVDLEKVMARVKPKPVKGKQAQCFELPVVE